MSDGHAAVQRRKLAALPALARCLDAVVLTNELGAGTSKPSPVAFRVACRLLGADAARAVYIGNDPRKDFSGARAAGLRTIRTGRLPDEGGVGLGEIDLDRDADVVILAVADLAAAALGRPPTTDAGQRYS